MSAPAAVPGGNQARIGELVGAARTIEVTQQARAIRQARGMSQEAFADLLGVHRTYLGGLERGERNLTLRSLERLAARLGVDEADRLPLSRRADGSDGSA